MGKLGRAATIGPEKFSDGSIEDGEAYGSSFSAVKIKASDSGEGSLRVTGGNKQVGGATVGPGHAGPFLIEVKSGRKCTFAGYYTIQLVYDKRD
ncbi:hypothetical protein G7Y89_g14905 [Cudoniella acicularis]|uniref:Uncharacterized protein n=1 Tax=Cudoniella acicularis TaxID=354080 RepID=A0A8H4QWB7_9HELO|nr:hypothetical protein G7Y89_g14905 [Cudoniella acicularis]